MELIEAKTSREDPYKMSNIKNHFAQFTKLKTNSQNLKSNKQKFEYSFKLLDRHLNRSTT